jgi:hypothetical protein
MSGEWQRRGIGWWTFDFADFAYFVVFLDALLLWSLGFIDYMY